jgi:putative endonuclease
MMNPVRVFHYVYVLKSLKDGKWYTGCTDDLRKRFAEHNEGKSEYTKARGPYELIYYEACLSKQDAFARERYLKSGMGKRYVNNRLKEYFKGTLTG